MLSAALVQVTARGLLLLAMAVPFATHGAETGEELAERVCRDCHGERGRSDTPDIPSIGGFSEFAIIDLIESYRLGFREARTVTLEDGTENDMGKVLESLSEEEVEMVAVYYAAQDWQPHAQPSDADLARRGAQVHSRKCAKCHLKGGSVAEADLAILSGQWRDYLATEMGNFDNGTRRMAAKMKKKYDTLSDADKEALLELYVSAGDY